MRNRSPRSAARILAHLLAALVCVHAAAQSPKPDALTPALAEKLKVEGLPNLGQVSATLFRGGQPKKEGYSKLKEMGVEIVVNLRDDKDDIAKERRIVEQHGMRFVSIPWNAWHGADDHQVAEFLEFLRANPERKIFVHCKAGKERTGVMIAAYRIAVQGWTAPQALDEMEFFGIRGFWFPHLKKYIRELPKRLGSDPEFSAFTAVSQPAR
jgi:protein tyrosine/serine phosphatase